MVSVILPHHAADGFLSDPSSTFVSLVFRTTVESIEGDDMGEKAMGTSIDTRVSEMTAALADADALTHLLCRAYRDPDWKHAVERSLGEKPLNAAVGHSGSKLTDVWKPTSPLRRNFITKAERNTEFFVSFAKTNPVVRELLENDKAGEDAPALEDSPVEARLLYGFIVCDRNPEYFLSAGEAFLESITTSEGRCEDEVMEPAGASQMVGAAELERVSGELKSLSLEHVALQSELKKVRKELTAAKSTLTRRSQSETALRADMAELTSTNAALKLDIAELKRRIDQKSREVDRLQAQIREERKGRENVTGKRGEDLRLIEGLRDELNALGQCIEQKERENIELANRLSEEGERRIQLQSAFEAFGFDTMEESLDEFSSAIGLLTTIKNAMHNYVEIQRAEEERRRRIDEERQRHLDDERAACQAELDAAAQREKCWINLAESRLADEWTALFPAGVPDNILIDGHNLIFRTRRPESERSTRAWLEKIMLEMAKRIEEEGHETRIELVFDTSYNSNFYTHGHGLTVHFANNTDGVSGADERIAQFLRERHPEDSYQIISTDRLHVWSDAIAESEANEIDVDLVQVEALSRYLEALQEVVGATN